MHNYLNNVFYVELSKAIFLVSVYTPGHDTTSSVDFFLILLFRKDAFN